MTHLAGAEHERNGTKFSPYSHISFPLSAKQSARLASMSSRGTQFHSAKCRARWGRGNETRSIGEHE